MIQQMAGTLLKVGVVVVMSVAISGAAQEGAPPTSLAAVAVRSGSKDSDLAKPASTPEQASDRHVEKRLTKPPLAKGVQDVLRMMDAGVSKEVIKTYVENARNTGNPGAEDLITLKEHGVPDDITIALLHRGSEGRLQNFRANAAPSVPAYPGRTGNRFYPDPESYDYFQNYYLYPRTLAWAYGRFGYSPAQPSYGYGSGFGLGPGAPGMVP